MNDSTYQYQDSSLPIEARVEDLVFRMTLEEKISQMVHDAPAIERLNVPKYNWWNECLHGVARAGIATVFPQAIGLAATWNTALMHLVATVISNEARAKHHIGEVSMEIELLRERARDLGERTGSARPRSHKRSTAHSKPPPISLDTNHIKV